MPVEKAPPDNARDVEEQGLERQNEGDLDRWIGSGMIRVISDFAIPYPLVISDLAVPPRVHFPRDVLLHRDPIGVLHVTERI